MGEGQGGGFGYHCVGGQKKQKRKEKKEHMRGKQGRVLEGKNYKGKSLTMGTGTKIPRR